MWLLITSLLAVHALSAVAAPTVGTNFIYAFPCLGDDANLFIYVTNSNNVAASLSIYSSDPNFDPMDQSVDAQSTQQIQFYDPDMQVCGQPNLVIQKGVLIQSTQPVSVYVDIESSDGLDPKLNEYTTESNGSDDFVRNGRKFDIE
uniref:Uncharacterized protein n=1 Tax=Plectus sambesii TaxID=2011161 RepID=A0A914WAG1_9BILA